MVIGGDDHFLCDEIFSGIQVIPAEDVKTLLVVFEMCCSEEGEHPWVLLPGM